MTWIVVLLILVLVGVYFFRKKEKIPKYRFYNYKTNVEVENEYVLKWNTELFVPNSEKVNYLVNFHTVRNYPYSEDCTNIFLDGEPHSLENINSEVCITAKKELLPRDNTIPVIYVPFFVWAFVEKGIEPELLIKNSARNSVRNSGTNYERIYKNKFCCFMYSNCDDRMDGVRNRKLFLEMMNHMTGNRVDNLGKCYNLNYKQNGWWKNNTDIFKPYKFVIAFENKALKGYITEKLINPMIARAIPIYLGAPDVGDYFNPKSFINVSSFPNFQSCIEYVLKVDRDQELYNSILEEPFLYGNRIDKDLFSLYYGGKFYKDLYKVMSKSVLKDYIRPCKYYNNNIVFMTFADGKVYKTDRIGEQAENSGFFKKVVKYSPQDFDIDFKEKHGDFIFRNKRGYGYWLWKPYLVLKTLDRMEYGDYLIFSDSGNTIYTSGVKKIREYYELLEKYEIVVFPMKYKEKEWNKMDTVVSVCGGEKKNIYKVLEEIPEQRTGAVFLIRKTEGIVRMVKKWYRIGENYNFIDDSPSRIPNHREFREHRHDQSIFSLLTKLYPSCVSVPDYDDDTNAFLTEKGEPKAFIISRLRT